ncbi:MAG TPA: glycosyltransferase [Vicinamibacterales bacterium]|nr:glycosyltransferase [Vicinamibacterales bacterium]
MIPTLTSGGAERVAVTVLSALDGARFDRTLYLFSREGAVYLDRVAPDVRIVVARRRGWLPRMIELSNFLNETRPDIVMPFLSYFITAVAAALSGGHGRVIFNQGTPTSGFLGDADFSWRRPLRRRLFELATRLFYRRADAVVVTSQGVADDLALRFGVPRDRMVVLHNPVDVDAIAAAAAEPVDEDQPRPLLVAAGRLAGVKNYPLLIDAVAQLADASAWILGDGPDRRALERLADTKGVGARIRFWGFQANPWRFIARGDVFVLTSTYEGFGNVIVEAMACGTPVVATRSPGTGELIEHECNGLLVDATPAAVASAVGRVLADADLRRQLVTTAMTRVRQYSTPVVARRYEQLFQSVAS